jgi:hypothetical protein
VVEPGVVKRVVDEVSSDIVVLRGTGTTALLPRLPREHVVETLLPTGMCREFALDADALRIGKGDCW